MHPVLFQFWNITIYSWGFFAALAFLVGLLIVSIQAKKDSINFDLVLEGTLYTMVFSIIGARVFYVIGFWNYYKDSPLSILAIWQGGMVFYGGLIFGFLALVFWSRKNNLDIFKILDLAAPSVAIGYAIGRIGCFLNGCCYGLACDEPWGVHFPQINGFVHPTQIYSSIAGILIFIVLVSLRDKKGFDGQIFLIGLILYSVYRFINEFFRFNLVHWWIFSPSQWFSILFFIIGICTIILKSKLLTLKSK